MDFEIVKFFASLGHGTIVDTISQIISSRIFLLALWVVVIGIVVRRCKAKRKLVILSFVFSALLFGIVGELGLKTIGPDIRGFRDRPYVAHADIQAIGNYADTSFPSDHVATVLTLFTVAVLFIPGMRPVGLFFALLMAFSRIHNGVHYPTDVLAGMVLGILYGWIGVLIAKQVKIVKYS